MTDDKRRAVIDKAGEAAYAAKYKMTAQEARGCARWSGYRGGRYNEMAEAALEAVGYFKLVEVVEAAREFDRLATVYKADIRVTGESTEDVADATTQLWDAGKRLTVALDALKEVR